MEQYNDDEHFHTYVVRDNPNLFPTAAQTRLEEGQWWDARLTYNSKSDFSSLTLDTYLSQFKVWPRTFDLHDEPFQNWAIKQLRDEKKEKWRG